MYVHKLFENQKLISVHPKKLCIYLFILFQFLSDTMKLFIWIKKDFLTIFFFFKIHTLKLYFYSSQ